MFYTHSFKKEKKKEKEKLKRNEIPTTIAGCSLTLESRVVLNIILKRDNICFLFKIFHVYYVY